MHEGSLLQRNHVQKVRALIRKDACMKFYNERQLLDLEIDVSDDGLGQGLLQLREGINCPHDEAPDNTAQSTTVFTSKSLSTDETR